MSLVAYDNSDESENEEIINDINIEKEIVNNVQCSKLVADKEIVQVNGAVSFTDLPKPKLFENLNNHFEKTDDIISLKKVNYSGNIPQPPKLLKGPIKISAPILTKCNDDVEEEKNQKRIVKKGKGLLGAIPPPKNLVIGKPNSMIPLILSKNSVDVKRNAKNIPKVENQKAEMVFSEAIASKLPVQMGESSSEDEDIIETSTKELDFFSLAEDTSANFKINYSMETNIDPSFDSIKSISTTTSDILVTVDNNLKKTLVSNIMNLPKEEILLKNKAEVGPKLPVPEQEYHIDAEGNVAFDEKAVEYLCGKRGVKRKADLSNINIIDINEDDIKPDEREWKVKAMTEEAIQRPISLGSGPGGQSKKKHQITYLAHQAKAMEIQLKNQWAQNKANKQQSRAKYGF